MSGFSRDFRVQEYTIFMERGGKRIRLTLRLKNRPVSRLRESMIEFDPNGPAVFDTSKINEEILDRNIRVSILPNSHKTRLDGSTRVVNISELERRDKVLFNNRESELDRRCILRLKSVVGESYKLYLSLSNEEFDELRGSYGGKILLSLEVVD